MLDPAQLPLWIYPLLFVVGLVAGVVDAAAGGGGLITLPVLLNLGLPVPVALGTNKLQSSFGSITASWHYWRGGVVRFRECTTGTTATLIGALAGAFAIQQVDNRALERVMPWLLAVILLYTLLRPNVGEQHHPPRLPSGLFFGVFGFGLGFYDGFFGPGTGSFWTIALIAIMGFNFIKATGYTKVMNATSNVASLGLFMAAGQVAFLPGLVMGVGQLLGARLGSKMAMRNGAKFIRPLFLTMVALTVVRLIYVSMSR